MENLIQTEIIVPKRTASEIITCYKKEAVNAPDPRVRGLA